MEFKFAKSIISLVTGLALSQNAFAAGQSDASKLAESISFPATAMIGNVNVTVEAFESADCTSSSNKGFFLGTGLVIDIAIGLVSNLLEAQKDGLQASYTGGLTSEFTKPIQCIKIERKKIASLNADGSPIYELPALMSLELLLDDANLHNSANRLALKKLVVRNPAPSKSKSKLNTRLNYAVTVAFLTVDSNGKERSFTRNLSLIPNVPLVGQFKRGERTAANVMYSTKPGERFESPIFAKFPNLGAYTATIAVSVTETDKRYSKAKSLSDFFDENSSNIDSLLGAIID